VEIPAGFMTTTQAAKHFQSQGVQVKEAQVVKWIDQGLHSGGRMTTKPRRPRTIEAAVVDQMIANAKAGNKPYHGLKPEKKHGPSRGNQSVADKMRRVAEQQREKKAANQAEVERLGPNWNTNFDTIAPLRRALWLSDRLDYKRLVRLNNEIMQALPLPPAEFKTKIVPLIQRELEGLKAPKR
jgi:hypothetical protein